MIKLIATDMDGTLLNNDGELPVGFYELLNELVNKGVNLAIASGRQYHTLLNNFALVKEKLIFIAENGAFAIHHGKELFSSSLDRGMIVDIIKDVSNLKSCDIVLCGKDSAYINSKNEEFEMEVGKYYKKYKFVQDLLSVEDDMLKIAVYDYAGSQEHSFREMSPKWGQTASVVVSGKHWMDFGRLDVDKGVALKQIQNTLGVTAKETLVFGDYFNDISMMEEAYYSYAMKNAPSEVKIKARFEAPSNNEEGVLKVIRQLKLEGVI